MDDILRTIHNFFIGATLTTIGALLLGGIALRFADER